MSAEERADLEAMHANEKRLYDQLDRLDEELLESRDKTARAEADKQTLLDEFETLQAQVSLQSIQDCSRHPLNFLKMHFALHIHKQTALCK